MEKKYILAAVAAALCLTIQGCGTTGIDADAVTHNNNSNGTTAVKITTAAPEVTKEKSTVETSVTTVVTTAEEATEKVTEEDPVKDDDEDVTLPRNYDAMKDIDYTNGYKLGDFSDIYMFDTTTKYLQAYDEPVQNEAVEAAVAAGDAEEASVGGYSFEVNGLGMVYSNEELQNCFDRLQQIINNSGFRMGFVYKNMDTGAYIGYNQYSSFRTCSTIKAPLVKCLLEKGVDLDDEITRNCQFDGDTEGKLAKSDWGSVWTTRELMELAIQESDNTAYLMLCRNYGVWDFNEMQNRLGSGFFLGDSWVFTDCTPEDMVRNYTDIYEFAQESQEGQWLIDLMCDTDMNIQIGQALGAKYDVAHKYGSDAMDVCFHDCAIVYAPSPFVLTIFTQQMPETPEACKVFKEISVVMDDINSLIAQ